MDPDHPVVRQLVFQTWLLYAFTEILLHDALCPDCGGDGRTLRPHPHKENPQ